MAMKRTSAAVIPSGTKWFRPLTLAAIVSTLCAGGAAAAADINVDFENAQAGAPPVEWSVAATNGGDRLARWAVERDAGPEGPSKILSLVEPEGAGILARFASAGVFNLAWMPDANVRDLDARVAIRANTGSIDQGGGLIWRARDAGNYYIARYNPLERNFRAYIVRDGRRVALASVEDLRIGAGEWFTMRIVHRGDSIEGYLNGEKLLEVRDANFAEAGGVGFWTKADAATSFDDLVVTEL